VSIFLQQITSAHAFFWALRSALLWALVSIVQSIGRNRLLNY